MSSSPKSRPSNLTLQQTASQRSRGGSSGREAPPSRPPSLADRFSWPGRICVLIALVLSPWAFASVQSWAQSWIAISLLVGLGLWWFETAMNRRRSQVFPYLFFPLVLGLGLGLLQTVELPDWAAGSLLGRQSEIWSNFSGQLETRPRISVDLDGTWDQLRLLTIALAAMLLGCRFFRTRRDAMLLMVTMTANGCLISAFGIIHKLTTNGKLYWVRELTLGGQPFGPFVNRNNAAGFLLICLACGLGLLPIVMSRRKTTGPVNIISREIPIWRQFQFQLLEFIAELTAAKVALLIGLVVLAVGVFFTLSRGGIVALLGGGCATLLAYGMARQPKNASFIFLPLTALAIALCTWVGLGEQLARRFEKIDLVNLSEADDRIRGWQSTWPAVSEMGPLGSGLGSYRGVHRLYRDDPETSLFLYAENQYFQSLVELGWPGLILFSTALILAFLYASTLLNKGVSSTTVGVGTLGMFLFWSQSLASIFDFGFYIPSNMLALAVLFGFVAYQAQSLADRRKESSWLEFQIPNYVAQVVILILFAAVSLVALDLRWRAKIESLLLPHAAQLTPETLTLEETDQRLSELMPLLKRHPTRDGVNYAAELRIHRARLQIYNQAIGEPVFQVALESLPEKNRWELRREKLAEMWRLVSLQQLHDQVRFLSETSPQKLQSFQRQPALTENIPIAIQLLEYSRRLSPLQPVVHLRLGELEAIRGLPGAGPGDIDMERAIDAAPLNPDFREVAGLYYLQSDNPEAAVPHFRKFLELQPRRFKHLMNIVSGNTKRSFPPMDPLRVAEGILGDDAVHLYNFAQDYLQELPDQRKQVLEMADAVIHRIDDEDNSRVQDYLILAGDVKRALGQPREAIEAYEKALKVFPYDREILYKLAKLYLETRELQKAKTLADELTKRGTRMAQYETLKTKIYAELRKQQLQE